MVQKRSWLHARSSLCAQSLPSVPALLLAWYGAKLAAVAFIVLLLFAFSDYWLLQSTLWTTVEPLYNGHFGTSHFWVIFALI